nr:uncharacterized protein LOC118086295 [Zootoca vivipara]
MVNGKARHLPALLPCLVLSHPTSTQGSGYPGSPGRPYPIYYSGPPSSWEDLINSVESQLGAKRQSSSKQSSPGLLGGIFGGGRQQSSSRGTQGWWKDFWGGAPFGLFGSRRNNDDTPNWMKRLIEMPMDILERVKNNHYQWPFQLNYKDAETDQAASQRYKAVTLVLTNNSLPHHLSSIQEQAYIYMLPLLHHQIKEMDSLVLSHIQDIQDSLLRYHLECMDNLLLPHQIKEMDSLVLSHIKDMDSLLHRHLHMDHLLLLHPVEMINLLQYHLECMDHKTLSHIQDMDSLLHQLVKISNLLLLVEMINL